MRLLICLFSVLLLVSACMSGSRPPIQTAPAAKAPETQTAPSSSAPLTGVPTVALLLPLSGTNALLGQNLLQAAQLALFDNSNTDLQLVPIDSAAPDAVTSAKTRGAGAIIGPVFAQEAKAATPIAQAAQLRLFALTNDRSAAAPGIYVMGITPESQIQHVLDYAASQGIGAYAALLPDNVFGRIALSELQAKIQKGEGQLIMSVLYPTNALDFTPYIQQLVDRYKTQPFQALLLPEGGARGKVLAGLLRTFGLPMDQVRLLGSSLWQDNATDPAFSGGWFAATPPDRWQAFMNKYQQTFSQAPDPRGVIVYDAISLLAAINQQYPATQELENPDGFTGLSGLFRLNADGRLERRLAILEAQPSGVLVKDPGPLSFQPQLN